MKLSCCPQTKMILIIGRILDLLMKMSYFSDQFFSISLTRDNYYLYDP